MSGHSFWLPLPLCRGRHMAATRAGRVPQPIYSQYPPVSSRRATTTPARPETPEPSPGGSIGPCAWMDRARAGAADSQRERELVSRVRSLSAPRLSERRAGARHLWPWPLDVRAGARFTFFLPSIHPIIRPIDLLRAPAVPRRWSLAGSAPTVSRLAAPGGWPAGRGLTAVARPRGDGGQYSIATTPADSYKRGASA